MGQEKSSTLAEVARGLPSVLTRLVGDPGRWAVVLRSDHPKRFLQYFSSEDGNLLAEAVSDAFLCDAERLDPEEVDGLRALGWEKPTDDWPNWRIERKAPAPADITAVASVGLRTMREVFGLGNDSKVTVKLHRDPLVDDDGEPYRIGTGEDDEDEGSIDRAA